MADINTSISSGQNAATDVGQGQEVSVQITKGTDVHVSISGNQPITGVIDSGKAVVVEFNNPSATGAAGSSGTSGTGGAGGSGYNFLDLTPSTDTTTATESYTITGKTMRCNSTGVQAPTVTVNSVPIVVTQTAGDLNIYAFTYVATLAVGGNSYEISSDNGTVLTKTIIITRSSVAPSCYLTHAAYFKSGSYTIALTADYVLTSTPTLDASVGALSSFTGSGKVWSATLTIAAENGAGVFSNAVLVGAGGTGTTITSGASYTVDTVVPAIGAANFSTTLWHYETGSMTCTVAMGETTTGFTGLIDLSHFGLSASYTLSPSGSNMVAAFTPARVDSGPEYGHNIRVTDRCGNPAAPKANTDNQLQVVAYRVPLENITFPAYTAASNALAGTLTTDANSKVQWGAGQTSTGMLVFGVDYTVTAHNVIVLDSVIWANVIAANALGLLNVDVWEN